MLTREAALIVLSEKPGFVCVGSCDGRLQCASSQCQPSPSLDYTEPFYTIDTIFTAVAPTMCLW